MDVSVSVSETIAMVEDLGEETEQDEVGEYCEVLQCKKIQIPWAIKLNDDIVRSVKLKWEDLSLLQDIILELLTSEEIQMDSIDQLRLKRDIMELYRLYTGVLDDYLRLNSSMWHLKNEYTGSKLTMDPDEAPEERDPPPFILEEVEPPFVEDQEVELETLEQGDYKRSVIALLEENLKDLFTSYPAEARGEGFSESDFFVVVDSFSTLDESITCLGVAGNRKANVPCEYLIPFSCKLKLADGSYSVEEFSKAEEWGGLELEGAVPQFIYSISSEAFILLAHDTTNLDQPDSKLQDRILHLFHDNQQKNLSSIKVADGISCSFRRQKRSQILQRGGQ